MSDLKPCPCGEVPVALIVTEIGDRWFTMTATCCRAWSVGFFCPIEKSYANAAVKHWNEAPRGNDE